MHTYEIIHTAGTPAAATAPLKGGAKSKPIFSGVKQTLPRQPRAVLAAKISFFFSFFFFAPQFLN